MIGWWGRRLEVINILVFGLGAEVALVAGYIERELPVEVKAVIDDKKKYKLSSAQSVQELIRERIAQNIEDIDVVVLVGTIITDVSLDFLAQKFPKKKFMKYGCGLAELINGNERIMVLSNEKLDLENRYRWAWWREQNRKIKELNVKKWEKKIINGGKDLKEFIQRETKGFRGEKLVIAAPELLKVEEKIREIVGWRAEVVDLCPELVVELAEILGITKEGKDRMCGRVLYRRPRAAMADL